MTYVITKNKNNVSSIFAIRKIADLLRLKSSVRKAKLFVEHWKIVIDSRYIAKMD